jgi:hypothetical protein
MSPDQAQAAPPKAPKVAHIAGRALCEITGLTDRRHRQLAADGYFPAPIRGKYETKATLAGLFRYYREQCGRKSDTLKVEQEKLTRTKRETAEEELRILREQYVKTAEIGPALRNLSLQQRATLQRKLENELGPKLPGKSYAEIRPLLAGLVDEICRIFREGTIKWIAPKP